jgi:hypothetical protein
MSRQVFDFEFADSARRPGPRCLNCGEMLLGRMPLGLQNSGGQSDCQAEERKPFLCCRECNARNYLIKEYAQGGVFWRLSHCVIVSGALFGDEGA